MKKIKDIFDYYFNIICLVLIIFLLSGVIYIIYTNKTVKKEDNKVITPTEIAVNDDNITTNNEKIKVDIKGAVKKPGVYEIDKNSNVSDLIKIAGGTTKKATTDNLNLSKTLENEMVVKVLTSNEYKNNTSTNDITECVCPEVDITPCKNDSIVKIDGEPVSNNETSYTTSNTNNNSLISINKATKEELMTLPGIGESKAISIIEYRNTKVFESIEDIKNVSGIGDALYEKIKEHITI